MYRKMSHLHSERSRQDWYFPRAAILAQQKKTYYDEEGGYVWVTVNGRLRG